MDGERERERISRSRSAETMDRSSGGDESVAEWSLGVGGRQMRVARGRELSTETETETEAHKLGKN